MPGRRAPTSIRLHLARLLALLVTVGTAGCTSGGGGATGGDGSGGGGAAVLCGVPADCPGADTECATRTCTAGICGTSVAAAGTVLGAQTPGDCQVVTCDGQGQVVQVADPTDVPAPTPCTTGSCNGAMPVSTPVADGAACSGGACHGGACVAFPATCSNGWNDIIPGETDVDCGGPCPGCGYGKKCKVDPDCVDHDCQSGHCAWPNACPKLQAGAPTGTWSSCSAGLDPTKSGGELLWTGFWAMQPPYFGCCLHFDGNAVGPTGDIAVAGTCTVPGGEYADMLRLNGSGHGGGGALIPGGYTGGQPSLLPYFTRHNDLLSWYNLYTGLGNAHDTFLNTSGAPGIHWHASTYQIEWPLGPTWDSDGLGNVFVEAFSDANGQTLDGSLHLPPSPQATTPVRYLVRGGPGGESYQDGYSDYFLADQTGGVFRADALTGTLDLGCGPLSPTSSGNAYLARFDAAWSCVWSRVLPTGAALLADGSGGIYMTTASSAPLDFGCGPLPAGAGGSTLVTHLDATGGCVAGVSLSAVGLSVAVTPTGGLVVSGLVGAAPVDLGGGPLAPLGAHDLVIGGLDAGLQHVWSRRFGGPGVGFVAPSISTSEAGDVYLRTNVVGAVDLGGGPLSGFVVASYASTGAHRWSRSFSFKGQYEAYIDGCGALVVISHDDAFDPGCGKVLPPLPPLQPPSYCPWALPDFTVIPNVAVARFQP